MPKTYNKAVINGTTYIDLSGDTVVAGSMRSGVTAHDKNGASITGSIPDVVFPSAPVSTQPSGTRKANFGVSTSARYYALPAGYLSSDIYYYFRPLVTSGITAANIKDGATITVGDDSNATKIHNVTGTFTDASTVSSGQTAAAAGQILSGYSAWVDGAEVQGSIANITLRQATMTPPEPGSSSTNVQTIDRSTSTRYIHIPIGYNSSAAYYTISAVANMTLPTGTSSTSSGTSKLSITPGTANKYLNIPTGYNTTASYYTIAGDADLKAENIADGVEIFGVTGTHSGGGPTCTLASGGVTWATCCTFPSNGLGWREEKYSDGRLIRWCWDWFTMSSAGRSCSISMSGATAFTATPIFTVGFRDSGNHACKGSVSAWSNTSVTVYTYENSYGGKSALCVRMEGYWK